MTVSSSEGAALQLSFDQDEFSSGKLGGIILAAGKLLIRIVLSAVYNLYAKLEGVMYEKPLQSWLRARDAQREFKKLLAASLKDVPQSSLLGLSCNMPVSLNSWQAISPKFQA